MRDKNEAFRASQQALVTSELRAQVSWSPGLLSFFGLVHHYHRFQDWPDLILASYQVTKSSDLVFFFPQDDQVGQAKRFPASLISQALEKRYFSGSQHSVVSSLSPSCSGWWREASEERCCLNHTSKAQGTPPKTLNLSQRDKEWERQLSIFRTPSVFPICTY